MANAVKKSLRCWCLLGAGHPITLERNGPLYPFLTEKLRHGVEAAKLRRVCWKRSSASFSKCERILARMAGHSWPHF